MGKHTNHLRLQIFLLLIFVLLAFVAVLFFTNLKVSTDVMEDQINSATSKSLDNIRDEFRRQVQQINEEFTAIYDDVEYIRFASSNDYEETHKKYMTIARSFATSAFDSDRRVEALYFYDNEHRCISYYRRANTPSYRYPTDIYAVDGEEDYNADIVRAYIESDRAEVLTTSYYNTYRKTDLIRFVYKIFINNREDMAGYIVCDMDIKPLTKKILSYTYYDDQIIYVQPVGDRIAIEVGSPLEKQTQLLEEISTDIKGMDYTVLSSSNTDISESDELFVTYLKDYGIVIYSMLPEKILYDSSRAMVVNMIAIAIAILAVGAIALWLLSNFFYFRYRIMQNNADYKALQAQINPHFLYNTLEAMSSMARARNSSEISDMCLALSGMFRYSMGVQEETVPLQKEVAHIRNYLYVMTTRMGNEIRITLDIKPVHMNALIPKMSLQPVVENAIKHGLKETKENKELSITSEEIDGKIHIIIRDNGTGLDAEALNKKLKETKAFNDPTGSSIGLLNINARIKLFYGNGFGIWAEPVDQGASIHIIIKK